MYQGNARREDLLVVGTRAYERIDTWEEKWNRTIKNEKGGKNIKRIS